jgi:hypothetical protein
MLDGTKRPTRAADAASIGRSSQGTPTSSTFSASDNLGHSDLHSRPVRTRRRSSTPRLPASSNEAPPPKSVELEHRLGRVELKLERACEELETTRQRLSAMQAQLDHLLAKFGVF